MATVQQLAREMAAQFETKKREDGSELVVLKDGAPEWMTDVIHEVHGDKLPDDTIYQFISEAVDALADAPDDADLQDAIIEIEADIYTHDLTAWLHARVDHVYYLTEVMEEFGDGIKDGFALLQYAQKAHKDEVGGALLAALEARAEDEDEE